MGRSCPIAVLAASLLAACATIEVETVLLDDAADFAAMRTFYVVPTVDAEGRAYPGVEAAITRALLERGRSIAEPDSADMWLVYRASTEDRRKRRNAGDPDANSYRIVSYVEGTLAIDVFDRAGARRVWHGQAVVDDRSREALHDRADDVVDAIFARFPDG